MAKTTVEYNPSVHGDLAKDFIKQSSDHKAIAEGAMEAIKEIRKRAQEELGLKPKDFNMMLGIYHKDAREKFENESSEVLDMYDAIFTKR